MAGKNGLWPAALLLLTALLLWTVWLWPRPAEVVQADAPQQPAGSPKLAALTFDDGPKPATTEKLLEGLDRRGAKATFFLIGKQAEENPALVERMARSGHQVGIHTYDHVSLEGLSSAQLDAQVGKTEGVLTRLLGPGEYLLRPPYGAVDEALKARAGRPIILWSVDPEDWHRRDVDRETGHILTHVQDGDIILLHDIFPESVDAALQVVDRLHQAGYALVTVSDLFAARGVALQPGEVYRSCPPR